MFKRIIIGVLLLGVLELPAQDKLYNNAFSLRDVLLLPGPFQHARDLNIEVLLKYDVDRLLAGYRKEAGLPSKAEIYPNWEGLDGHIGGHYLSALAMNYAATGNLECKRRMEYIIATLKACQEANGKKYPGWGRGYVGAVPNGLGLWPEIKSGNLVPVSKYWVPWYNVHKMYAGLRDAWLYAGNEEAKSIFLRFCDWAVDLTAALSEEQMQQMLGIEHGGMNEVFADAYQMTGNQKYLVAAKRFSHRELLDPLSKGIDNLDNKHANTQVPKAIGFERVGELSNNSPYKNAGRFFWETVAQHRSLALGGNSRREFFPGAASCYDFVNDVEGPESCNTYNMLKLTQDLFRLDPNARYMDFYERALFNHILSAQHPGHGGYVYFTPARPRHYRVYSAPGQAMWCCVGSGMENHGKYGEQIYTHQQDSLFLNLFIASELNWKEKGIRLKQETAFPDEEKTKLTVTEGQCRFTLMIRYPSWVKAGAFQILVNGKPVAVAKKTGAYTGILRTWKKGDVVQVALPMRTTIEHLPHVREYIAIMHGPILLGARTGTENLRGLLADDGRWSHIAGGEKLPVDQAPVFIEDKTAAIAGHLVPVKGKPMQFQFVDQKMANPEKLILEPFFRIHDARYMMYWMALTPAQYSRHMDSVANAEKEKLELEKRTVDFVAPGEQQPEADHVMRSENSKKGVAHDQTFREAAGGGYFSYLLSTGHQSHLGILLRFWGGEWGRRKFDIYVDDEKLASVDNSNKWNQSRFFDVVYEIPDSMVKGKTAIRIKFQAVEGVSSSPVYYLRLVKQR
ncbi:MAG: glycoside hydrolase family 127 protein [Niabella sp.]|nr:glycoside hydrolase family 127 protein [Niabella sp.]